MRKVEYYIAEDGKRFDNEEDCINYEIECKVKKTGGNLLFIDGEKNITDSYDDAFYIVIRNAEAVELLDRLCNYNGWYTPWEEDGKNKKPGVYHFNDYEDKWENFEEVLNNMFMTYEDIKFLVGNEGFETLYEK